MAEKDPDAAVPAEGKAEEEKGKEGGKEAAPESPWLKLLESAGEKLATLIISAGSLLGFVAFAGSVVLWSRFFAIHVPPDQVVAAVPRGESIAVGSVMLLLFGFFGALAALAVYLIDRGGRATPGMSRALLLILTVEAAVAIWITGDSSILAKVIASEIVAITFAAALWSTFMGGLIELKPNELRDLQGKKERGRDPEETAFWQPGNKPGVKPLGVLCAIGLAVLVGGIAFGAMRLFGASARWSWIIALGVGGAALALAVAACVWRFKCRKKKKEETRKEREKKKEEREKEEKEREKEEAERLTGKLKAAWKACRSARCHECDCRPCACHSPCEAADPKSKDAEAPAKPPLFELTPLGAVVIVALALVAVVGPSLILQEWWLGVSLSIVFVVGAGLWRIAGLRRERFIFLGMAVFISVPLFGALMLMVRNLAEPQVQAVALIRSSDGPDEAIQGLYVTESSDRVYFANVATEGCTDKVTPASGRLLWVPKSEVVAMSIGPLEDVEDAGTTALEMAYALTPAVETPAGDHVSLTLPEARFQKAKKIETGTAGAGAAAAPQNEKTAEGEEKKGTTPEKGQTGGEMALVTPPEGRLEDPGPAVRPNFGAGLRLDPETASPSEEVTLTMSAPNEDINVKGFGSSREGRNLRLGGVIVDIAKEKAGSAAKAEYIEVGQGAGERLLHLSKEGAFLLEDDEFVPAEDTANKDGDDRYLRLEDPALRKVNERLASAEEEIFVKVNELGLRAEVAKVTKAEVAKVASTTTARLAKAVTLGAGEFEGKPQAQETIELSELPLYRQAWHEDHIKFRVPENAKSGVVTVECGQLAGSPLLRVSHTPTARIAVRMRAGSQAVTLNSSRSSDEDGEKISRRWTIEGVHRGHLSKITTPLPLRSGAYSVKLTVADEAGHFDTATLRLLRLPDAMFEFGKSQPDEQSLEAIRAARKSLEKAVAVTTPVAIELDGHADNPGAASFNLRLSLKRDDEVRDELMPEEEEEEGVEGDPALPVAELAYGETCPIDPGPGRRPRNRRVEVFVLDEGVTVKPAKGCIPGALKHASWYPAPSEDESSPP